MLSSFEMQFGASINEADALVLPDGANAFAIATIAKNRSVLVITPNTRISDRLINELESFEIDR